MDPSRGPSGTQVDPPRLWVWERLYAYPDPAGKQPPAAWMIGNHPGDPHNGLFHSLTLDAQESSSTTSII
jgi:hypothetical protein